MSCRLTLAFLGLALLLAACSPSRPEGSVCTGSCSRPDGPVALVRTPGGDQTSDKPRTVASAMAPSAFGERIRTLMQKKADILPAGIPERALFDLPDADEGRLHLLALSAGRPFGAFGAGFLNGWSSQTADDRIRPQQVDVVAGMSTGALLATHAFLGRGGDAALKRLYATLSTKDLLVARSGFSALSTNSLFDTTPLRRTLESLITSELLDQVADAAAVDPADGVPGRLLLVLAIDLDSGLPRILDLGAIARKKADPNRIQRYVDALMAAVAIPVVFPPVFIDGAMHADGGTRLALFFKRYIEEQRAAIEGRSVPAPKLDIIVGSELSLRPACTRNSLTGIATRQVDVLLDQSSLDSLYRMISEAEGDGIAVRYVTAEGSGCRKPDAPADPLRQGLLECLFAFGQEVGSGEMPWRSGLSDFPSLEIDAAAASAPSCPAG